MNNSIGEIFRIDFLGKRIFVRVLFLFLVLLNLSVIFFPLGDNNFDAYFQWMNAMVQHPEMLETMDYSAIPLTEGNITFLISALAVALADLSSSWLYTGLFIRNYRLKKNPDKAISLIKLILRFIALVVISTILLSIFSVFVLYLSLIFIIILPYLIMIPACYLSGDYSLLGSVSNVARVTRGYYLTNSRNLSLLFCIYLIGELILRAVSSMTAAGSAAMTPFLNIFILLSLGRYVGIIYLRMLQVPGGFRIIVTRPQQDNDVQTPDEPEN